jgi:serine/threonine protein kinase
LEFGRKVVVKEYCPHGYAFRDSTQTNTISYDEDNTEIFSGGKEKFISEAQMLAQLSSLPGIVPVNDFFTENNTAYVVSRFIEGETLKSYLYKCGGKVPFDQLANLLRPVIESLGIMHRNGVIHRDISSDNILIAYTGEVKLIGFGAARNIGWNDLQVKQIDHAEEGPRMDIYSVCAMIYQALTGVEPPKLEERPEDDFIAPPSAFGVIMPGTAEPALMKGLELRAEDRFPDIEAFIQEFYNNVPLPQINAVCLETVSISAQTGPDTKSFSFLRGSVFKKAAVIAAAVLLAVGIAFLIYKIVT